MRPRRARGEGDRIRPRTDPANASDPPERFGFSANGNFRPCAFEYVERPLSDDSEVSSVAVRHGGPVEIANCRKQPTVVRDGVASCLQATVDGVDGFAPVGEIRIRTGETGLSVRQGRRTLAFNANE
jgi:hypothetical protein